MTADEKELAQSPGYRPFMPFEAWLPVTTSDDVWSEYLVALDEERSAASEVSLQAAVDAALRTAAIETGAIEGLYSTNRGATLTIAVQATAWELAIDELGADVRGHFDAQLQAFEMVLDLATGATPITEAWIRQLHIQTCSNQATYRAHTELGWQDVELPKGKYKTSPNHVVQREGGIHYYASVEETASEIARLVQELRSEKFSAAAPQVQAAYIHHAFTAVHPFADGNGRVSRALASVYLYRALGIPLIVYSDQQLRYWDALAAADQEDFQPFVSFIEDRALDGMATVTDALRKSRRAGLAESSRLLREALGQQDGYSPAELSTLAARVSSKIDETIRERLAELVESGNLPSDVQRMEKSGTFKTTDEYWGEGYASLEHSNWHQFHLSIHSQHSASTMLMPVVGRATENTNRFTFKVVDSRHPNLPSLYIRSSDVHPELTATTQSRIDSWVEDLLTAAISELANELSEKSSANE